MGIASEAIDKYCTEHSTGPSAVCAELERYTRENVPMAGMVSGPLVAGVLGIYLGTIGAKRVLEVGCFTGYSALAMAERLPADGEVITLDINPETNAVARRFWEKSPHGKKIKAHLGPALERIPELRGPFDLVFIDADKENYLSYLRATLPLLSKQGLIVADNCLWRGQVLDDAATDTATTALRHFNRVVHEDPSLESVLLPVRDGLHVIRKRAAA